MLNAASNLLVNNFWHQFSNRMSIRRLLTSFFVNKMCRLRCLNGYFPDVRDMGRCSQGTVVRVMCYWEL